MSYASSLRHRFEHVSGLLLCMLLGLTACSSITSTEQRSGAVKSISHLKSNLESANLQVDQTIAAANGLQAPEADLNKALKTYQKEVRQTHEGSIEASKRIADLRTNAAIHIQNWERELATLQNAQLRKAASQQSEIVKDHFDKIYEAAADAKEAYQPFVADLDDLEAYLLHDLSASGVKASAPTIKQINESGSKLKEKITAILDEIDVLTKDMAAANPPAPTEENQ